MLHAHWKKYTLKFKRPSGTSRGILKTKESWFIFVTNSENPNMKGIGECGLLKGLSEEADNDYEKKLAEVCENINDYAHHFQESLTDYASIRFGLEMALKNLQNEQPHLIYNTDFFYGKQSLPINGLIWMGTLEFMQKQIDDKLSQQFRCIKIKIGAVDFEEELSLLKRIRKNHSRAEVELRVDANGAFDPDSAMEKLERLAEYDLHSIEQPIETKQWDSMAALCEETPVPIALDEELIGVNTVEGKRKLLHHIKPQYVILKPSLIGGLQSSEEWIKEAGHVKAGWWATSALESDIGLNAIAQWVSQFNTDLPQGLGTGGLYTNNFRSPLYLNGDEINYDPDYQWDIRNIDP